MRHRKAGDLCNILTENGQAALPDIGGRRVDDDIPLLHLQPCPALVRQTDTDTRILHRAGDPGMSGVLFKNVPHRQKRLLERCRAVRDLSVRQDKPRLNRIPEADLPRGEAGLLRQQVDHTLERELTLCDPEAAECACRRIVRIVPVPANVRILVGVRSDRVRAGTLQNRPAEGGIGPCIKEDLAVKTGKLPVFIAAERESGLHGVALGMEIDGLLPGKMNLHSSFVRPGCERRDVLRGDILLSAEAPADELILDNHPLRIPAEHDRNLAPCVVGALVG